MQNARDKCVKFYGKTRLATLRMQNMETTQIKTSGPIPNVVLQKNRMVTMTFVVLQKNRMATMTNDGDVRST